MTGDLLGTLRYMSPEQALARRGVVDHRTDVYSLGATLYELLTLRPAFEGRDREELLRQIADEEPPPPRDLDPAVPAELETIVLKALAQGPGRALRHGPGAGRRPAALPRRPADPGPAADAGRAAAEVGAAAPVGRRGRGRGRADPPARPRRWSAPP